MTGQGTDATAAHYDSHAAEFAGRIALVREKDRRASRGPVAHAAGVVLFVQDFLANLWLEAPGRREYMQYLEEVIAVWDGGGG